MQKRGQRGATGCQAATWCSPHHGRAERAPRPLGPLPAPPFGLHTTRRPKTIREESFCEFRRRPVVETNRGENTSPAGRFRLGEHLPEGEIVAIVITIVPGITEIIINIIPNISTIFTFRSEERRVGKEC